MHTKRTQKEHSGRPKFRGWRHPFLSAPTIDKTVENFRKQMETKRTRLVFRKGISKAWRWKRLEENDLSEGVIRTISKQTQSGKSICLTDEADA